MKRQTEVFSESENAVCATHPSIASPHLDAIRVSLYLDLSMQAARSSDEGLTKEDVHIPSGEPRGSSGLEIARPNGIRTAELEIAELSSQGKAINLKVSSSCDLVCQGEENAFPHASTTPRVSDEAPRMLPTNVSLMSASTDSDVAKLHLNTSVSCLPSPFSPSEGAAPLAPSSSDESESSQILMPAPSVRCTMDDPEICAEGKNHESRHEKSQLDLSRPASAETWSQTNVLPSEISVAREANFSAAAVLSQLDTQSDSLRHVAPPLTDDPLYAHWAEPVSLSNRAGSNVSSSLSISGLDWRRHSFVDLTAQPPSVPSAEMRRYSLVDSAEYSRTRSVDRIRSNVGFDPSFKPRRRARPQGDVVGLSRPQSQSYSTFAEMGIQSFVMAKGEKTVDAEKREKKKNGKGGKKPRKGDESTTSKKLQASVSADSRNRLNAQPPIADPIVQTSEASRVRKDEENITKGNQMPKRKDGGCIIM